MIFLFNKIKLQHISKKFIMFFIFFFCGAGKVKGTTLRLSLVDIFDFLHI